MLQNRGHLSKIDPPQCASRLFEAQCRSDVEEIH